MVDNDPANGQGFESAVAYAVAEQLGYAQDEVTWSRVPFDVAIQPGPKQFDFDINQFSITEERREAVDFSSPYYDVRQAVVAVEGNPAASAASIAELQDVRFGAQVGTTSLAAVEESVQPATDPQVFNTNDDAKLALDNGQIDALVVDLPTAFYLTAAEIEGGVIVGQLPEVGGEVEQFGLVLDKDSPLTECVSEAVDALRDDGTLDDLEQEWLADVAGAPELS
jgi:polar amino acid transport system substrate-binding protein